MANIQSKKKRHAQDEKKRVINHSKKAEVRTIIKKTRKSNSTEDLQNMYSVVDKAAKTKRIHKNKANRIKSRVTTAANI